MPLRSELDRQGYAVCPGLLPDATCEQLIARAGELVAAFEPDAEMRSIFTTHEQTRSSDAYFLGSGDQVRFFFEEEAFLADGSLRQSKAHSINKIGHALHEKDPVFAAFSASTEVTSAVAELGLVQPVALQSMYIFKNPFIGGDVGAHQDAAFLYTEPVSVVGLWFALEEATLDNGCLWALPGGHRGPLRQRFVRAVAGAGDGSAADDGCGTHMVTLDPTPLPPARPGAPWVPLPVPRGSLVVLHGLLPHWSAANRSPRSRQAYSLHFIDGACHYPADNWLRRRASAGVVC
jgi:phytanoyl-CoA hydroxylase